MKVLLLLAIGLLSVTGFAQDKIEIDSESNTMTLTVDGNSFDPVKLLDQPLELFEGRDHLYFLHAGTGRVLGNIPLRQDSGPALTGILTLDALGIKKEPTLLNIENVDLKDYSKQKLFNLGKIPVYSTGPQNFNKL